MQGQQRVTFAVILTILFTTLKKERQVFQHINLTILFFLKKKQQQENSL